MIYRQLQDDEEFEKCRLNKRKGKCLCGCGSASHLRFPLACWLLSAAATNAIGLAAKCCTALHQSTSNEGSPPWWCLNSNYSLSFVQHETVMLYTTLLLPDQSSISGNLQINVKVTSNFQCLFSISKIMTRLFFYLIFIQ